MCRSNSFINIIFFLFWICFYVLYISGFQALTNDFSKYDLPFSLLFSYFVEPNRVNFFFFHLTSILSFKTLSFGSYDPARFHCFWKVLYQFALNILNKSMAVQTGSQSKHDLYLWILNMLPGHTLLVHKFTYNSVHVPPD